MKSTLISRFTPSLMEPETLEAIFVQREDLAQRLVELIRDSALTPSKHHTLLVGPRGIGKTHVIALVYHRIRAMEDLHGRLLVAWCREEEWGVTSFLDLLLRIFRALAEQYNDDELKQSVESLYELESDAAERKAEELLKEYVGDRALLLLAENLGDVFHGLGDEGQKRLRSYLQENPFMTILATAQSLFSGVSLQTSPFYGFFRIYHLEELELDDATLLLTRIAQCEGDKDLASFIQNPIGRARIRAVHHLAGGNHRVYVIFSQLLTRESLDELVEMVVQSLDDLTPYYQSRIAWLSPQQRKIVELLCDRRHPLPVKEIAQRCFITHQTAASQLKDLREKGYLRSEQIGRESYHELHEPLMRLSLEVKKERGSPIRLIVDFLRLWYTPKELRERLELLPADRSLEREYICEALQTTEAQTEDPRVEACVRDFLSYLENRDFHHALAVAEELIETRGRAPDLFARALCLAGLGHHDTALLSYDKALKLDPDIAVVWLLRGQVLRHVGRVNDALKSFEVAIEQEPNYLLAWKEKGVTLAVLGRYEEALRVSDKLSEMAPVDGVIWTIRATILYYMGRYQESLSSCERAIGLNSEDAWAHCMRSEALVRLGRYHEALVSCDKTIEINPKIARVWVSRSLVLAALERYEEALEALDKVIELGQHSPVIFLNRAVFLMAIERWKEGFAAMDDALGRCGDVSSHDWPHTRTVVGAVLISTQDFATWRSRITELIETYEKHRALAVLGESLTQNIREFKSEKISDATADEWYKVWQELAGKYPEFEIPLRLLKAAVRYHEKKDRRILMELPMEERKILEELLEAQ